MIDLQAKSSFALDKTHFKIPLFSLKSSSISWISWQTLWNNSIGNMLLVIKSTIGEYHSVVKN